MRGVVPPPRATPPRASARASASRAPSRVARATHRAASAADDPSRGRPASTRARCPVCHGTGWKPCGQCDGTGTNPRDAFGGKFKAGDACWLCEGKNGARTMCGVCVDLTDTF